MTEAAKQIKNDNCKIIGVAMEMGFESADGFTRAFFKEFGIKPSSYKIVIHLYPILFPMMSNSKIK